MFSEKHQHHNDGEKPSLFSPSAATLLGLLLEDLGASGTHCATLDLAEAELEWQMSSSTGRQWTWWHHTPPLPPHPPTVIINSFSALLMLSSLKAALAPDWSSLRSLETRAAGLQQEGCSMKVADFSSSCFHALLVSTRWIHTVQRRAWKR